MSATLGVICGVSTRSRVFGAVKHAASASSQTARGAGVPRSAFLGVEFAFDV